MGQVFGPRRRLQDLMHPALPSGLPDAPLGSIPPPPPRRGKEVPDWSLDTKQSIPDHALFNGGREVCVVQGYAEISSKRMEIFFAEETCRVDIDGNGDRKFIERVEGDFLSKEKTVFEIDYFDSSTGGGRRLSIGRVDFIELILKRLRMMDAYKATW